MEKLRMSKKIEDFMALLFQDDSYLHRPVALEQGFVRSLYQLTSGY
jgi:hypothetical protein